MITVGITSRRPFHNFSIVHSVPYDKFAYFEYAQITVDLDFISSVLEEEKSVEMLYYITMCQLTILYSFRLRLVSHLYSVDSPVCFFSSSIIISSLISDFIKSD